MREVLEFGYNKKLVLESFTAQRKQSQEHSKHKKLEYDLVVLTSSQYYAVSLSVDLLLATGKGSKEKFCLLPEFIKEGPSRKVRTTCNR